MMDPDLLYCDFITSIVGFLINFALAFLLARRPPGLIGRYRPIQGTIIALDVARCLLVPLIASHAPFLSTRVASSFSVDSLLQSLLIATVTSQYSVIIMGFVYRYFTLKGSRLNGLLSFKWIVIIILFTIIQSASQALSQRYIPSNINSLHYFILASSFLPEAFEVAKFILMFWVGYRTHRFIRCAIFTKQASKMHKMGLKVVSYQALVHLIFSLLPLVLLPRVTTRFTNFAMAFNGLQAIIDPIIVMWLTPEYRKMIRKLIRRKDKRRPITYVSVVVPNYTKSALEMAEVAPKSLFLAKEVSLFSRYCSKV